MAPFRLSQPQLALKVFLIGLCVSVSACKTLQARFNYPGDPTFSSASAGLITPKVVIITMFEVGEDEGDAPGEFQLWKTRRDLNTRIPFPQSHHDIFYNPDSGVMAIVTGMGTAKSSSAIMALGMDPRFDLRKSYFLVAGIAGVDPEDTTVGSAAWAKYVVDGDLAHHIDAREIPEDWETGYFPLFSNGPFAKRARDPLGEVFALNDSIVQWAYELTKDMVLPTYSQLDKTRKLYTDHPKAQAAPKVILGDQLAGMTFWHGALLNQWANKWVKYWTDGKGEFVTSAMEDTGTYQSLFYLDRAGRADVHRLLVLRTASNFTMQSPDKTAAENLTHEGESYEGLGAALESAYLVGSKVVDTLLANWHLYENTTP